MRTNNKDEAAGLPGYGGYSFHDEDTYKSITLILPSAVVQTLKDEALAATLAQEAKESAEQQASKKAEDDRLSTALKPRPSLGSGELDPDREAADLRQAASGSAETSSAAESVAVYGVLEPLNLIKDLKARTPDRDIHKRNEALYRRIKPKGHRRALAQPQVDALRFDHLRRAFPHFAPVLDLVQDQHAFAELTGKPIQIPPILLGGDPGIGKTRFSVELSKALGTVIRRLPFDNGQSGASLLGSDKNWANTTYGVVFELVVLGEFAKPAGTTGGAAHAAGGVRGPAGDLDRRGEAGSPLWQSTAHEVQHLQASPGNVPARRGCGGDVAELSGRHPRLLTHTLGASTLGEGCGGEDAGAADIR